MMYRLVLVQGVASHLEETLDDKYHIQKNEGHVCPLQRVSVIYSVAQNYIPI